jgi:Leucine-rich repeat (LRR) protein
MKITRYEKYNSVSGKSIDLFKALDSIKNGSFERQIKNVRLFINDKEKRDIEKKKLPLYGFGGTFSSRGNNNLIQSSGIACLDFDYIEDLDKLIEEVNKDKFTLASFVSPSGNGLKVIVKIPPVSNDEDYKSFYIELQNHYNQYGKTDESTKDIARASFVSFDPNLFINVDSEKFTDRFVPKLIVTERINIPLQDMDEVSTRLIKWFNKKWTTGQNRNNNLYILSSSFNDYGVSESIALNYCKNYISADFTEKEIEKLVSSAYKNKANFGKNSFEDSKKVAKINRLTNSGSTLEQVKNAFQDIDGIEEEFNKAQEKLNDNIFWFTDDNDKLHISNVRFDYWLQKRGISKYFPHKDNSDFDFIIKDENFVDWTDTTRIKDMVKRNLIQNGDIDIWDNMAKNTQYFKRDYLSMMDTVPVEPKRDTRTESFLYYKNKAVRTTKDGIELLDYENIDDLIWKNQVIDRDIVINDKSDGEFKTFLWRLSGENKDRYFTLKSVIGYLMHSYQNPSKPKAIIFNDEMISDDIPNGGSGKGLIHKAIGHIKNVCIEDGKKFDPRGQFAYQKVNKDTQIFLMDDVPKTFNFESLFSIVTEGMTVEKKGKDAFQIPFTESPKVSITTNYTVKGEGASHYRRIFEVEIANHYNDNYSPEDEFKHQFFSEWSIEEWAEFDNFMIRCIQYFLKNGLVESNKINLDFRKFKQKMGVEFIEFMESQTFDGSPIKRKDFRDRFNKEYPSQAKWNTAQKFNSKVKDYCEFHKFEFSIAQFNSTQCFYIKNPNETKEKEESGTDGLPY